MMAIVILAFDLFVVLPLIIELIDLFCLVLFVLDIAVVLYDLVWMHKIRLLSRVSFGLELVVFGSGLGRPVSRNGDPRTTTTPSIPIVTSATGARTAPAARARCQHDGRRPWAGHLQVMGVSNGSNGSNM